MPSIMTVGAKVLRRISQMPERHVDYLTLIVLPFVIYQCCTRGASHPKLDAFILLAAFTGVGMVRALRFPGLLDAAFSLPLGLFVGFASGSVVQELHPTLGGPASWQHLGIIGGLTFSASAIPIAVLNRLTGSDVTRA